MAEENKTVATEASGVSSVPAGSADQKNIDPGTGDIVTITPKAPSAGVKILDRGGQEHQKMTKQRLSIDRNLRYENIRKMAESQGGKINGLTADEWVKFIETENAQGRPVHVRLDSKIGKVDYLFQPKDKEKREAVIAAAESEAEKEGFWSRNAWLKWALIGLGTAGLGFLVGYLIKKSKTKTVTKTISGSGDNPESNKTPGIHDDDSGLGGNQNGDGGNVTTNNNTNTGGNTLENSGTPVTDTTLNPGEGYTPEIGIKWSGNSK